MNQTQTANDPQLRSPTPAPHAVRRPSDPEALDAVKSFNIGSYLPRMARERVDQPAVIVMRAGRGRRQPRYCETTFGELETLSNRYASGLTLGGIARGTRVLVMVRPGVEFIALVFAMFKIGAVPVMIDPGMGVHRLLDCIRSVDLDAFIGVPLAHVMRFINPEPFRRVKALVTVGRRWSWGGVTLKQVAERGREEFALAETRANEPAAILFTSGSTGPAKGVVYGHQMFDAQIQAIQSHYQIEPGEVDLPTFPLFALFSIAMGMTSVIPDMDASRPAYADPARIVRAIKDHQVTNTFGSPALWNRVAPYCVDRGIKLPSLKRVLIAGAPVRYSIVEMLHKVLSAEADVHTPYGATEALPVCSISGRELLHGCIERSRRGAGTCVGRPVAGQNVAIIQITDEPLPRWSPDLLVPDGDVGEVVVSGPVVTEEYFNNPDATRHAKTQAGILLWHRMGDVGYRDAAGRIWFCGRKTHRVVTERETLFTIRCEAIFNEHPRVFRSALVGVGPRGRQRPVIVIEPKAGQFPARSQRITLQEELRALGQSSDLTRMIRDVLFRKRLPVDIRHNAKIHREELAKWAERMLR